MTRVINICDCRDPSQGQPHLTAKGRLGHMYVLGKTRTGKSTFLLNLIKNDLDHATIVLDPAGSFALQVASLADKDRLIYVDKDHPIVFNPLMKYKWDRAASEFASVMNECVTLTTSSRESSILMRSLMLYTLEILDDEDKNIEYLARFFDSQDVRKAHFSRPGKIMPDWWQEFEEKVGYTWPKKERRDAASRVSNRLTTFYKDTIIRPFVIGDDEFDVVDIVQNRKIVVFNMHGIDDDGQLYLGNLLSHAVKGYVQYDATEDSPPLFYYIDEFHRFVNEYIDSMMTQAGKYNVSIHLAHQNHQQISIPVRESVVTSPHTLVVFKSGYYESKRMAEEFMMKPTDFQTLPPYHMQVKIGDNIHYCKGFPPPNIEPYSTPVRQAQKTENQENLNFLSDAEESWIPI